MQLEDFELKAKVDNQILKLGGVVYGLKQFARESRSLFGRVRIQQILILQAMLWTDQTFTYRNNLWKKSCKSFNESKDWKCVDALQNCNHGAEKMADSKEEKQWKKEHYEAR